MKRKKKKLSELRAWIEIKRELTEHYDSDVDLIYGLCGMIDDLEVDGSISYRMAERMYSIVNKVPRPRRTSPHYFFWQRGGFFWDLGKTGIKARISFCNKQIERLTT